MFLVHQFLQLDPPLSAPDGHLLEGSNRAIHVPKYGPTTRTTKHELRSDGLKKCFLQSNCIGICRPPRWGAPGKVQLGGSTKESTESTTGPGTPASPTRPKTTKKVQKWKIQRGNEKDVLGTFGRCEGPCRASQEWRSFLARMASIHDNLR